MSGMTFGEKIGRLCDKRGWKAAELARRLGVSPNTVGRWLSNERRPYDDVLLSVSRLFDVRADFLIDDAVAEPPTPTLSPEEELIVRYVRELGLSFGDVVRAISNTKPARD